MKVSISKAADILGVSITTLRRWDAEGKLRAERTPAGHRRYDMEKLNELLRRRDMTLATRRYTLIYARVVAPEFRLQLAEQVNLLTDYCRDRNWEYEVVTDLGRDVSGRLPGLRNVVRAIAKGNVERLVLIDANRVTRPAADLLFTLCQEFRTEVVVTHQPVESLDERAELALEMEELVETFEARLPGRMELIHEDRLEILRSIAEVV